MSKVIDNIDVLEKLRAELPWIRFREVLEAYSGLKVSRIDVSSPQKLEKLTPLFKELGLCYDIADFKVKEVWDEKKGGWHNKGLRVPYSKSEGVIFLYLASSQSEVLEARLAEKNHDHEKFGSLLKIPICCRNFYKQYRQLALDKYDDEYAVLSLRNSSRLDGRGYPYLTNYLSQYFGYSFVSHFPCKFTCQETISRAKASYQLMEKYYKLLSSSMPVQMKNIILFENRNGLHGVSGAIDGSFIRYDVSSLISTQKTFIGDLLKQNNYIQFVNPFQFYIGDHLFQSESLDDPVLFIFEERDEAK